MVNLHPPPLPPYTMFLFYVSLCSKTCGFQCNIQGNQHCKGGGEGGEQWRCIVGAAALIEGGRGGGEEAGHICQNISVHCPHLL